MPSRSPNHSPREELLTIQKEIFHHNQRLIEDSILIREKGFEDYQENYHHHVVDYDHVATIEELQEALSKADIIYVGDYHTNKQSQRGFLRILKMMVALAPRFVIALELIHQRYQKFIDQYLKGEIEEKSFLEKIHLKRRWYFDLWENFQPIFDFAKYHQLKVYGMEAAPTARSTLKSRDRACAKTLFKIIRENPDLKLLILIGDLHIAPEHLPVELQRLLKGAGLKKDDLILYQNSEQIYWKLASLEMEEKTEIVRADERSFCIMNTPPIIWQQSYINWLEHEGDEIDFADAKHNFLELVDRIASFLKIELPSSKDEVEVYTSKDLSFLKRLEEDADFKKKEIQTIKKQILAGESYYIPKKKIAYLASLSLNHAAEEATHFIRHLCAGDEFPRDPTDAFYANILHEALGFLGSKIINLKRKCFHEKDFESLVVYFRDSKHKIPRERSLELDIAHFVLEHKKMEQRGRLISASKVLRQKTEVFLGITHALGYMLGDRLFYALMAEKISREELKQLFCDPFKEKGAAGKAYQSLIGKVGKIRLPRRV